LGDAYPYFGVLFPFTLLSSKDSLLLLVIGEFPGNFSLALSFGVD